MKAVILFVLGAMLAAAPAPRQYRGVITCSMCGTDHAMMNATDDAKCVVECVRAGGKYRYVLVDGTRTYRLSDQQLPEKFAAKRVVVTGVLYEKTQVIKVDRIELAK
jgi:hypothetical protein